MALAQVYPCFPACIRGQPSVLKLDPTRNKLLYALGPNVVIRDVVPPSGGGPVNVQLYTGHSYPVTAVEMAPSGCFVASGDDKGTVLIWACDNPEQPLKLETSVFGGAVLDIAWSGDSQRLIACGDGKASMAKVIMWDSGNSVGEISGHAKKVNSCSFKSSRPFRIATGGDDNKVNFYEGPPFKYSKTAKTHERFVNMVRFSPSGDRFFSVSSDMHLCVYDGKTGEMAAEGKVHAGSINGAMWSSDSTQILTCSGDGSAKVLDAGSLAEIGTLNFLSGDAKKKVEEQQVGCAWTAHGLLTYSLGGVLNLTTAATDASPALVQRGHSKPISCLAFDETSSRLLAGSFEDGHGSLRGQLLSWDLSTGVAASLAGAPHANAVVGVAVSGGTYVTCSTDDTVCFSSADGYGDKVPIGACPKGFSCGGDLVAVVTTTDKLVVFSVSSKAQAGEAKLGFSPTCVSVAPNDALIAAGGEDNNVHVLGADGSEKLSLARHKAQVSCVSFSPSAELIASGCANKEVVVWSAADGAPVITGLSGFHTARVSCIAWSPDGGSFASGGVDAMIIVWDVESKKPKHTVRNSHTGGAVLALKYESPAAIISAGADANIKRWAV